MPTYEILGVIIGILFGISCFLVSLRQIAILQQCNYSEKGFFKWYFSKGNIERRRISLFALALLLLTALFPVSFSFLQPEIANLTLLFPLAAMTALYLFSERKYALKVPAKRTHRLVRLAVADALVCMIFGAGLGVGLAALSRVLDAHWFLLLRFLPLAILPLACFILLALSSLLMKMYEIPHNRGFLRRAKRALDRSTCVKVGITGSFGKTSVKHFASQMLSQKFKVISTPASFNTPLGIARTVLHEGLSCDIFLAEMGARHVGDIRELCDLVQPTFGVVTGVCEQHIETFLSLENIKKEKGELARYAKTCILGKTARDLPSAEALREGEEFSMENLLCTKNGSTFTLNFKGERIPVEIPLLGACAAEDVALAAALCHALGMTLEEIAVAAKTLAPVPHRLQKLESGGVTVLDDAYNSNIAGAKNAIETLKLFDGAKFVVTPGLVELGELQEPLNSELGSHLVGLEVILVGETLVLPVRKGYLDAGGEESRLRVVPTLSAAQEILSKELKNGDCVLFLNDLPDCYL